MIARFGDCEIDLDRLEVRVARAVVAVEPQVFDVLSYLVEHRERMVTKEELLDNVWGDRFVTESALTSRIKSARKALGDNGRDQAVIKTVHGRGYQFVADVEMTDQPEGAAPGAGRAALLEPHGAPSTDAPDLDATWPLVGRHDEVDLLIQLLGSPECGGVMITGPADIGKTRLARVALDHAHRAGSTVAHVNGRVSAEEIPLAALAHLLPADVLDSADHSAELVRTIVFQRARQSLCELAAGGRLVMLVDNADRLDDLSRALLSSLITDGTIFGLLTQRTSPGDPLAFDELVRSAQVAHLDLGPLDDTDLDVLLYRVLEGPIDLDSLQQLTSLSRGRPGALQQLVETCRATQALDRDADVWRLVGPIRPAVGAPGPDQLLIESLDPAAVTAAELLALARELDLDLATDLIGPDVLDVLDRAGLLALTESGNALRVRIAQNHVAMLLVEGLGPLRARRHKTRLIAALADEAASDHDHMRRTRWMVETGSTPELDDTLRASRFAVANADGSTADVLLDHLDGTDEANRLRAELHFRRGQMDAAEALLDRIDTGGLEPHVAASVARRRATIRFHVRARYEDALALLDEQADHSEGPARDLVNAHWIGLQGFLGRSDPILRRVDALGDDLDRAPQLEVLRGTAQARVAQGSFQQAIDTLDQHDRQAIGLPAGAARAGAEVALATRIAAHTAAGQVDIAADLVDRNLPVGRRTMLAWLPMAAARAAMMAGRPGLARELISTPLAAVRSQNLLHAEPQMTGILAQAKVRTGEVEAAIAHADACWAARESLTGQLAWSLLLSVADVAARTHRRDGLVDALLDEADRAAACGARLFEAELLMAAARSGEGDRVGDRLATVVEGIEGELWTLRSQQAIAGAVGDRAALERIGAAYRTLGYHGYAESIEHALAHPARSSP